MYLVRVRIGRAGMTKRLGNPVKSSLGDACVVEEAGVISVSISYAREHGNLSTLLFGRGTEPFKTEPSHSLRLHRRIDFNPPPVDAYSRHIL